MLKFVSTKPPRLKQHDGAHGSHGDAGLGTPVLNGDGYYQGHEFGSPTDHGKPLPGESRGYSQFYNDSGVNNPQYSESASRFHNDHWNGVGSDRHSDTRLGVMDFTGNGHPNREMRPTGFVGYHGDQSQGQSRYQEREGRSYPMDSTTGPIIPSAGHGSIAMPMGGAYSEGQGHGMTGIRPHSYGPNSYMTRVPHHHSGNVFSPIHRFDGTIQGGNVLYGPPYSLDSTGSMSLDSLSTSGDRSSKSVSETPDYDSIPDALPLHRRRLDIKPPINPQKRHVHLGRGGHGLCQEAPATAVRPGFVESQMTSSLRKSPGAFRSGHQHHVRWDPDVVNSNNKMEKTQQQQQEKQPRQKKKSGKLLTRVLKGGKSAGLNLPKFPVSDDDFTDYSSDSGYQVTSDQVEVKESPKMFTQLEHYKGDNSKGDNHDWKEDLACFKYRSEMPPKAKSYPSSPTSSYKTGVMPHAQSASLSNVASSKSSSIPYMSTIGGVSRDNHVLPMSSQAYQLSSHQNGFIPSSTIVPSQYLEQFVHQERDRDQRKTSASQIHSVRPLIINGQDVSDGQFQDYDNSGALDEVEGPSRQIVSVQSKPVAAKPTTVTMTTTTTTTTAVASPYSSSSGMGFSPFVSTPGDIDNNIVEKMRVGRQMEPTPGEIHRHDVPVSFDTFVTLGRPHQASVTFDTFVTLGRPYASSTPVPSVVTCRGNITYSSKMSDEHNAQMYTTIAGPFATQVTNSMMYGGPAGISVPYASNTDVYGKVTLAYVPHSEVYGNLYVPHSSHVAIAGHFDGNRNVAKETQFTQSCETFGEPLVSFSDRKGFTGHVSYPSHSTVTTVTNTPFPVVTAAPQSVQEPSEQRQSQFKEFATYHQRDNADYDDDVFSDVASMLEADRTSSMKSAKRKLIFENGEPVHVMTSCVPQLNHDMNNDTINRSGYPRVQPVPGISQRSSGGGGGTMSTLHDMMNRSSEQSSVVVEEYILDMVYITERIISMSFASEEHENTYKQSLKEVTRMLKTKHGDNYLVINISDKRPDLAKYCPQVLDYGWPDHLAPPLERLCSICKAIDSWLGSDVNHVVVVHCKGGRGRIAVVIAAYMRYSNICASADQALDRFAMKRFYDDKLGGLPQPSQRRYVHYFAGLLSGAIQINSNPLYLHHILIHGVPNFDTRGGCRPFIKVYQGMTPIFTSGVYNVTDNMQKVCISISPGIPLRGDILIKCYHKKNKAGQREIMWGCQFHTCAISHNSLVFSKSELDDAIADPRFPDEGKVEFVFGSNSEGNVQVTDFKSDVTVPVDDTTDALVRWDSYENFGKSGEGKDVNANGIPSQSGTFRTTQLEHSSGPVDGNLYAQVNKRKLETTTTTNIVHQNNGPTTRLQNGGSYTSSLDSVPMGSSQLNSSETRSYNTREQDNMSKQNYSTSFTEKSSYNTPSATSPRQQSVKAMDEQTQLDQILSDLLNDQAFVSHKSPTPKSHVTLSKETHSFRTVENQISPDGKVTVQRAEVEYKVPEVTKEEKQFTVKTKTVSGSSEDAKSYNKPVNAFTYTPSSPEMSRSFEPIKSPKSPGSPKTRTLPYRTDYDNRYTTETHSSYNTMNGPRSGTSLSDSEQNVSWLQQQQAKLRGKSLERDPQRMQQEKMLVEELKSAQTSNKYFTKRSQSEEEKPVTEVAFSRSQHNSVSNGPTSPYSYTVSRTHTYPTSEKSDILFGTTPEISQSHTTYTQAFQQETQSTGSKVSNKPPPSPSLQRSLTPTQSAPPVPPPARTSSKDYMQQQQHQQQQQQRLRSNSGSSWQNQTSSTSAWQTQTQPRTQRHYSESAYDREHFEKQQAQPSYSVRAVTPPLSPRSASPTTYQTYRTVYKTVQHRDEPDMVPVQVPQTQMEMKRESNTEMEAQSQKPHYITEVIVHRTGGGGGGDSKTSTLNRSHEKDSDSRLEALEQSLKAASASIMAQTPWQQENKVEKSQEVRRFETRTYETKTEQHQQQQHHQTQSVSSGGYPRSMSPTWDNVPLHQSQPVQQSQPAPRKLEVTEEDRITLKPIGPGVQQLEPEGSHMGTLGRATTPSFPISPVASAEQHIKAVHEKVRRLSLGSRQDLHVLGNATPPFPVTPRTPYQNLSVSRTSLTSPLTPNSVFEHDTSYNAIVARQLARTSDPLYSSIPEDLCGKAQGGSTSGGSHMTSPTGTFSETQRMQYNTYQQSQQGNNQQYNTHTLPSQSQGGTLSSQGSNFNYNTNTLPPQSAGGTLTSQGSSSSYNTQTLPSQQQLQQQQFQLQQQQQQQLQHQQQQQLQQQQLQQQQLQQQQQQQQHQQQLQQQQYSSSQQYHTQQYNSSSSHSGQDGSLHVDTSPRMLTSQQQARSPGSPSSPGTLNSLRQQLHIAHNMSGSAISPGPHSATGQSSPSVYFGLSRRGSLTSLADSEAVHTTPRFVKDTSKYWYKPSISREDAIVMLKDKAPGTFVVRDSNSFPGAFGLALKVSHIPPNVQVKSTGDPQADLVRHFLIEPTPKGVRLRGCSNEPVFGSLAALVYQHSITPLALPCKLVLPDHDPAHIVSEPVSPDGAQPSSELHNSAHALLTQGAACNVLFLNSVDTESLTGPQAVAKACKMTFESNVPVTTTVVHFKVSNQGITLTDNQRKLFFRRHYPVASVTYCGMDPEDRRFKRDTDVPSVQVDAKVFGFVGRKQGGAMDNTCHLFAELDPDQPSSAIVNFVTKVMIGQSKIKS